MRRNPALAHRAADPWDFLTPEAVRMLQDETVDTRHPTDMDEYRLSYGNVARPEGRVLVSHHVTDDPDLVLRELKAGSELSVVRQTGDLGGGFYVSNVPHLWGGRARSKWAWIGDVSDEQMRAIVDVVAREVLRQRQDHYITEPEMESAMREIGYAMDEPERWGRIALSRVINQPYNIQVRRIAEELGIRTSVEPEPVRVELQGRFVNASVAQRHPIDSAATEWAHRGGREWELRARRRFGGLRELDNSFLRALGYDGKWSGGMGDFQMVVWNTDAIRRFGRWRNPRPAP